jgi:hypothetical protein
MILAVRARGLHCPSCRGWVASIHSRDRTHDPANPGASDDGSWIAISLAVVTGSKGRSPGAGSAARGRAWLASRRAAAEDRHARPEVGDLNSEPLSTNYLALVDVAGLTDAWVALHGEDGGDRFTCCQLPTLTNPESLLASRIDYVLFGGAFEPLLVDVVGDVPLDPPLALAIGLPAFGPFPAMPAGMPMYWASDHAGVVAELRITKEKFVAR